VVLRCQKDRRGERRGPGERVAAHLDGVINGAKRYRQ
jgi:hypothetical protein